jgi:23S rRNA pseudouridine2457 synthase
MPGFYAAGRLDKNSEGLLLLSNNGAFQHHLTHPKFSKKKYYWVQIEGIPTPRQLQPLRDGLRLRDTQFLPAEVTLIDEPSCLWARTPPIRIRQNIPTSWLEVILKEGKNHQIRKMTAAVGFPTLRLIRHQIGEWKLGGLMPGEYRILKDHGYTTLPILETTVQRSITQQTNPRPKKHS